MAGLQNCLEKLCKGRYAHGRAAFRTEGRVTQHFGCGGVRA